MSAPIVAHGPLTNVALIELVAINLHAHFMEIA